jgi:cardiolipin synthase (CMP-forming)
MAPTGEPTPPGDDSPAAASAEGESAILTVPNLITSVRLACLPVYLYLLFGRDNRGAAALLLAALGATDWVDGYVARRFHQVSTVGKVLDPVADRLLFFVGVGGIIVVGGAAPAWFSWAVIAREVFVSVAVVGLAVLGAKRIDVTLVGKAGTFCLMFAFPMFLAGSSDWGIAPLFHDLAWVVGLPGLVLSYWAAATYVPIGLRALREGRSARRSRSEPAPG